MLQESRDLLAEADALHAFLQTLSDEDWGRPTAFMQWTPWDVVAHLLYFDRFALLALTDPDAFAVKRKRFIGDAAAGVASTEIARREIGGLPHAELLDLWIATDRQLAEALAASAPERRVPWFGPDMGIRMFTTARYMETWAHGQEVYDLMRVRRVPTDRIKNVAVIGVKTFGWSFAVRGLEVPGPAPHVRLVAPSGAVWEWNEPDERERICGDAVDFCQVVTQGRNVADTALEVVGEIATRWMSIAQCFAGGPVDPPKPGQRSGA